MVWLDTGGEVASLRFKLRILSFYSWRRYTKCDYKCDQLWVRLPPEEMKYLFKFIFRGVVFRHSARNVYRIGRKVGNGVSKDQVPSVLYPVVCGIHLIFVILFLTFTSVMYGLIGVAAQRLTGNVKVVGSISTRGDKLFSFPLCH